MFMENVAALTRRGLPRVLGDLAGHGYDVRWTCVRASETVGACHPRYRWFGLTHPVSDPDIGRWYRGARHVPWSGRGRESTDSRDQTSSTGELSLLPTPTSRGWKSGASNLMDRNARPLNETVVNLLPTPKASDGPHGGPNQRDTAGNFYLPGLAVRLDSESWKATNGKDYGPAVQRWGRVIGRPAPCPTEPGTRGNRRLSPAFEEWMMGLPAGWVTAVSDIPRTEQMRILGNGVVWQQGRHAFHHLLTGIEFEITEKDDMTIQTEEAPATKAEKPRGKCTGCAFDYQLGTARTGDYKGQQVIRKHLSRVGPGECDGSRKPPAIEHGEATGDAQAFDASQFADPAPAAEQREGVPPLFYATYEQDSESTACGHDIAEGDLIQADGSGDYLCSDCIVEQGTCACGGVDPDCPNGCGRSEQLPHDRGHETITHIPNGHDLTDSSGTVWRHGGEFKDCTVVDCVQFRNRLNPPPVSTPVQHQCENGLYADIRNCPRHGTPTTVEKLPVAVAPGGTAVFASAPGAEPAGHLNGVPTGYTHAGPGGLHQGRKEECTLSPCTTQAGLTFADPTPAPAELPPVSGQPEPDRDQWGRYKILGVSHTRATTFAKLGSSTFALGEWNERMELIGLTKRPDLLARAHGLDVKRDAKTLNKIVDEAQEFAGNKVAANIGTAYHTFTERLDAGVCTLDEIPEQWRGRCKQYVDELAAHGLTTRREWIERTTAVRADQVSAPVPVAGTLDRILRMPNGDLVIGDLKTSSNIEYSWSEIAVQLALYAHGVNTFGLFDWNRKEWETHDVTAAPGIARLRVRTDYAIVMHLPADGDGCTLYRVDLVKGWKFAQVSGMVQSRQKAKDVAGVMVPLPRFLPGHLPVVAEGPAPAVRRPEMSQALALVASESDPNALSPLHQYAIESGVFTDAELSEINDACAKRWQELNVPY
jgi:hypothetical protein